MARTGERVCYSRRIRGWTRAGRSCRHSGQRRRSRAPIAGVARRRAARRAHDPDTPGSPGSAARRGSRRCRGRSSLGPVGTASSARSTTTAPRQDCTRRGACRTSRRRSFACRCDILASACPRNRQVPERTAQTELSVHRRRRPRPSCLSHTSAAGVVDACRWRNAPAVECIRLRGSRRTAVETRARHQPALDSADTHGSRHWHPIDRDPTVQGVSKTFDPRLGLQQPDLKPVRHRNEG